MLGNAVIVALMRIMLVDRPDALPRIQLLYLLRKVICIVEGLFNWCGICISKHDGCLTHLLISTSAITTFVVSYFVKFFYLKRELVWETFGHFLTLILKIWCIIKQALLHIARTRLRFDKRRNIRRYTSTLWHQCCLLRLRNIFLKIIYTLLRYRGQFRIQSELHGLFNTSSWSFAF